MTKLEIRPLVPDDYEALCLLWANAGLTVRLNGRDSREQYLKQLARFQTSYLAAVVDRKIVGCVFGSHDLRRGWINRIAVHPEVRRRGVGARLIEACEKALYEQGIGITVCLVEKENVSSAALFAAAGYSDQIPVRYFYKRTRPDI